MPGATFRPLVLTEKERGILTAPPALHEVEIRPDNGAVYMPEIFIRRRLNAAFGPGQWTLWENKDPKHIPEFGEVVYDASLIVRESAVSRARGGRRWKPADSKARFKGMTFASAVESAKSECLRRCAKDLGVGTELWDGAWREAWKREHAKLFEVMQKYGPHKGELSWEWHRRDRPPKNVAPNAERRGQNAERRTERPPSERSGVSDGSSTSSRSGTAATESQVRAIKNLCKGMPVAALEAQLKAHGVPSSGRIEDLSKSAASEIITWAQSERASANDE